MSTETKQPHLQASEILQLIDGDASSEQAERWQAHLGSCAPCAGELEALRRNAAAVTAALGVVSLPEHFPDARHAMRAARLRRARTAPSPSWGQERWVRRAAAILVVLLPLALISPLRAAVLDWLDKAWEQIGSLAQPSTPTAPVHSEADAEPAVETGTTLWFTPSGPELEIELAERQESGRLVVTSTPASEASLVLEGVSDELPLITEDRVRILNRRGSGGTYTLSIPDRVERVRVIVAGVPLASLSPQDRAPWVLQFPMQVR